MTSNGDVYRDLRPLLFAIAYRMVAFCLDIADGVIQTIRSVINPGKLRHLGPPTDLRDRREPRRPRPG